MKLENKITINTTADKVWQVVAHEFDQASVWMAQVPNSYRSHGAISAKDAPMEGRVCELSDKPGGPVAEEYITGYSEERKWLRMKVIPKNAKIPVIENVVDIHVNELSNGKTEVIWASDLQLKTVGKMLSPVLKLGINKSFNELLEELKYYVENGKPHPRKLAKAA